MKETDQHQNVHTITQLINTRFLKKVTQLLISVTVFLYLFSQLSLLTFLQSYNFYFSTFLYQLITHTIDKNYMFLVCNGLLVFLVKYSGLFRSSSLSNRQDEFFRNIMVDGTNPSQNSKSHTKELILNFEVAVESFASDIEEEKENDEYLNHEIEETIVVEDEEESGIYVTNISKEEEGDGEEEEESREGVVEYEEEELWSDGDTRFVERAGIEDKYEEEEEDGKLSTEELNKKFDDFIRKMKTKLRIEAQRQLIMV